MELGLSLGDGSRQFNIGISSEKSSSSNSSSSSDKIIHKVLLRNNSTDDDDDHGRDFNTTVDGDDSTDDDHRRVASSDPPVQLDLLPLAPVPRHNSSTTSSHLGLPWSSIRTNSETGLMGGFVRGFDVNRAPSIAEDHEINNNNGNVVSSPNSTLSSFHQMEFSMGCRDNGTTSNKRDFEDALGGSGNEIDAERACSRASDDEDNALNRKKLRLSKEQSAFLEESFKEHSTLNPVKTKARFGETTQSPPSPGRSLVPEQKGKNKVEANRGGLRVSEKVLRDANRGEQKITEGAPRAENSQDFESLLHATSGDHSHHVPLLRASRRHLHSARRRQGRWIRGCSGDQSLRFLTCQAHVLSPDDVSATSANFVIEHLEENGRS
ncbi:hypothetical protein Scep_014323 [Stephania cephalantha]|uniref:HD-ZIP protein N-terminal domain-containing protein n=1 Tax=Stephania cephalantha TaxID=152367 RepID=A0AAP0J331_9MAGN